MAQFDYNTWKNNAPTNSNNNDGTKVGFFKLKNNGDEALVRFDVQSVADLLFASIHQLGQATKWMKVSCLNTIGTPTNVCPLCAASQSNPSLKATQKLYLKCLVSYKDASTGTWSAPVPVIWERPAGFAAEIANKLKDYGSLRSYLFKITRNGAAGDMKTTYSLDFAMPQVFKPEMIPEDFSAFNNFQISKHSYWEKSIEDINTYLRTGAFPQPVKAEQATTPAAPTAANYGAPYVPPTQTTTPGYQAPAAAPQMPPVYTGYQPPVTPTAEPAFTPAQPAAPTAQPAANPATDNAGRPVRNFTSAF